MLVGIFQIPRTGKYFQGTVRLYGEVLEVAAELFQIEGIHASQSVAHRHLEVIVDVLIYVAHVFLVGKGVGDTLVQVALVVLGVEEYGIGFQPVASAASRFLEVCFG